MIILTGYQTKLKSVRISVHIRRPLKFPIVFACLLMVCSDQQQLEDENTLIFICQLSLKGGGGGGRRKKIKKILLSISITNSLSSLSPSLGHATLEALSRIAMSSGFVCRFYCSFSYS